MLYYIELNNILIKHFLNIQIKFNILQILMKVIKLTFNKTNLNSILNLNIYLIWYPVDMPHGGYAATVDMLQ